ncbi:MAG: hypothetical protein Q8K79_08445, partial [Solirubrobacteraceae bacterium]|nr:hypothetical protein [Solirubrobacteraceae bacterium]
MRGAARSVLLHGLARTDVHTLANPYATAKLLPARDRFGESIFLKPVGVPLADDGLPVPPAALRQGYSAEQHLELGRRDVGSMLSIIESVGGAPEKMRAVLELGSGPGR